MIEIGEPPLLTENFDGRAASAVAALAMRRRLIVLRSRWARCNHPVERLDREGDTSEHNRANNPKLAH